MATKKPNTITAAEFNKLVKGSRVKNGRIMTTTPELENIKQVLKHDGIGFTPEFVFDEKREFRFDIAFPEHKVAIEYEGINASKSRHTTITGYTEDCNKYNLATSQGWRVLRYTVLNYGQAVADLKRIIEQ